MPDAVWQPYAAPSNSMLTALQSISPLNNLASTRRWELWKILEILVYIGIRGVGKRSRRSKRSYCTARHSPGTHTIWRSNACPPGVTLSMLLNIESQVNYLCLKEKAKYQECQEHNALYKRMNPPSLVLLNSAATAPAFPPPSPPQQLYHHPVDY